MFAFFPFLWITGSTDHLVSISSAGQFACFMSDVFTKIQIRYDSFHWWEHQVPEKLRNVLQVNMELCQSPHGPCLPDLSPAALSIIIAGIFWGTYGMWILTQNKRQGKGRKRRKIHWDPDFIIGQASDFKKFSFSNLNVQLVEAASGQNSSNVASSDLRQQGTITGLIIV